MLFRSPAHGWLDLILKTGKDRVFITTSAVYDPYPNMLAWLEAIAEGHALTMVINDESDDYHFQLTTQTQNPEWLHLTITAPFQRPLNLLEIKIRRFDLVQQFYSALHQYVGTQAFVDHWLEYLDLDDQDISKYQSEKLKRYLADKI